MASLIDEYSIELYKEHLEECSFLYDQRGYLQNDPEITWKDLNEFEDRMEAHIDALVVGEELALDVCRMLLNEADTGELYTAVKVFCRQNRGEYVADAWRSFELEDVERVKAISDAMKDDCPDSWQESLTQIFLLDYFNLIPVAAPVFGYRRYKAEKALLHALKNAPMTVIPDLCWTLGRVGENTARAALLHLFKHCEGAVRAAVAESLLRFGEKSVLETCMSHARFENWPFTALGLGGGRSATSILLECVNSGKADSNCLMALGLLGNLSAIKVLYSALGNEALARPAAVGLYLITGAEIYEEVYVPDDIDEDELFPQELEAYRNEGTVPTKPDGQPYGETIRRLSQNPVDWEKWIRENRVRFNPNQRYRLGTPYSPASLLNTLLSEASPYRARQLAIEEFKIRYNADFHLEADMPVARQEEILQRIDLWVQSNEMRFKPGAWYFYGRIIPD